jgi:hypothetical protein
MLAALTLQANAYNLQDLVVDQMPHPAIAIGRHSFKIDPQQ